MKLRRTIILGAALVAGAGCGRDSTAPTQVSTVRGAVVSLRTPNADDGAVVITLRGPDLTGVQAASGSYLVYSRPTGAGELRVIVMGDLTVGPVLRLTFAGPQSLTTYSAFIEQVATRSDALRDGLAGYEVKVTGS
jgi:hypothetical protein